MKICALCSQTVRWDKATQSYYHVVSEQYPELETIAREVKDA